MSTRPSDNQAHDVPDLKARVEVYLGYLKIELNIMGILSTFCIAALSLILRATAGAERGTALEKMWEGNLVFLCFGTGLLLCGGLSFYRQRSLIAEFYGELCCAVAAPGLRRAPSEILEDVEHCNAWRWYRAGFAFTVSAIVVDFLALVCVFPGIMPNAGTQIVCSVVITVLVVVGFAVFEYWLGRQFKEASKETQPK